jgi:hypothetical protein
MFGRTSFLLVIVATLLTAGEDSSTIREREDALARAVKAKDKVVLATLTNKGFQASWTCGSAARSFSAVSLREDWIDRLIRLRIYSYKAVISKIDLAKPHEAFVELDEFWVVRSPRAARIEKHLRTLDTWFKLQGEWKLVGRLSAPYPRDCPDDQGWALPR